MPRKILSALGAGGLSALTALLLSTQAAAADGTTAASPLGGFETLGLSGVIGLLIWLLQSERTAGREEAKAYAESIRKQSDEFSADLKRMLDESRQSAQEIRADRRSELDHFLALLDRLVDKALANGHKAGDAGLPKE